MTKLRWIGIIVGAGWMLTAQALSWQDWWKTRDHQAEDYWHVGQFSKAANLFQRPDWQAAAAYRAKDYPRAAQNYLGLATADGYYNAGNALAQSGQYQAAVAAYDQAIQRDPSNQDALFNRGLVKKLLEQQKQQPQSENDKKTKTTPNSNPSSSQSAPASNSKNSAPEQQSEPKQDSKQPSKKSANQSPASAAPSKPTKPAQSENQATASHNKKNPTSQKEQEQQQANEQWLRLIPDDPAYLLREKFLRDHLRRQQGATL